MRFAKYRLCFFFSILAICLVHTHGLECHNCYGNTGDLNDCHPISLGDLSAKLRQDRIPRSGSTTPSLTVSRHGDACIKFSTEYLDQNGYIRHTVVRTQILKSASSLFFHDSLSDYCYIQSGGTRTERGVTITTNYCACTADYCNNSPPKVSRAFWTVLANALFSITFVTVIM